MELIYVFGVALGLALAIGLIVRKGLKRQDQRITMEQWRATVRWPAPPSPQAGATGGQAPGDAT